MKEYKKTYTASIGIDSYPDPAWAKEVSVYTNGVVIRRKNARIAIQDTDSGYVITTYSFYDREIPELLDHPMVYVKKLRGRLYCTQRLVQKDSYECTVWGMNYYLEQMSEAQTWTHKGNKELDGL